MYYAKMFEGLAQKTYKPHRKGEKMAVEIQAEILRTSDKGVQIQCGRVKAWLPKSQIKIEDLPMGGDDIKQITIPDWLAKDKGLTL